MRGFNLGKSFSAAEGELGRKRGFGAGGGV